MLSALDLAILGGFIVYSIYAGLSNAGTASRNLEEYFLAGRSLKGWQAGISMAATQFAADTPLVVMGLVATAGVFSLWRLWVYAIAFLLLALVLAPAWRRANVITDAELTEIRYGGAAAPVLRATKAIYFGLVFNCTVLAMVLLAAARITEPFLLWDQWLPSGFYDGVVSLVRGVGFAVATGARACAEAAPFCSADATCIGGKCIADAEWVNTTNNLLSILAIVTVTTLYSTTGGLRSVVRTDFLQFILAMVATFVLAWILVDEVGGLDSMYTKLVAMYEAGEGPVGSRVGHLLALTPGEATGISGAFLGVLAVQWFAQINADGSGYLAQRSMACETDRDAAYAGVVFTVAQVVLRSLCWIPIALALILLFPFDPELPVSAQTAAREGTYVLAINEYLPSGLKGLMLTGMLGALASTVDTHLNWGSSYMTNDIYRRFIEPRLAVEGSRRRRVWVARLSNVLILVIAILLLPFLDSIQEAWRISLLLGAGVGPVLVLRWIWWRITAWGELASLVASGLAAPLLLAHIQDDATRLLLAAAVASLAGIAVSLLGPHEQEQQLRAFFERVKPPGVWTPFEMDHARSRLGLSLGATACASLATFCALVGIATPLIHAPTPIFGEWGFFAFNMLVSVLATWLALRLYRSSRIQPAGRT